MVAERGVLGTSVALALGRETIARLAGGLPVQPGTILIARQAIDALDRVEPVMVAMSEKAR